MSDCKHEKLQIRALNPYGFNIYCVNCDNSILHGDYVILTKTHKELMDAVIEAGREYMEFFSPVHESFDLPPSMENGLDVMKERARNFYASLKVLGDTVEGGL